MRAVVQARYGGPEVLRMGDREAPIAGQGEVVVRVAAAGVDAGTVHLVEGRPALIRAIMPLRGGRVPGGDLAGTVHEVGAEVAGLQRGDEVYGVAEAPDGSLAEFARVRVSRIAAKPMGLSFAEAAAVPTSATAALRAVRDAGRTSAGDRVLVLGAGGGVGHFAVQIAKSLGGSVVAACSAGKAAIARASGADHVVDYRREDPLARGPFDVIIDTGGHRPVRAMRRALSHAGALVVVGSEPEGAPLGGITRSLGAAMADPFTRQRLVMLSSSEDAEALRDLAALVEAGELWPIIDREFALDESAEALRHLGHGAGAAKTVVRVA
ncbi:NAD(P)-dependent alcohol dehydrogenase [Microbacterium suaedae]|uniref:NAD(P)-dependent alcohol dehydrogenase n=1 Tax=Microbacterium suaedae TaxID=2067813 RepID=UPI000DAD6BD2|nr:NAD(P)-dependent alcohol dehydrogenase [Microbacterium suaedae]